MRRSWRDARCSFSSFSSLTCACHATSVARVRRVSTPRIIALARSDLRARSAHGLNVTRRYLSRPHRSRSRIAGPHRRRASRPRPSFWIEIVENTLRCLRSGQRNFHMRWKLVAPRFAMRSASRPGLLSAVKRTSSKSPITGASRQ